MAAFHLLLIIGLLGLDLSSRVATESSIDIDAIGVVTKMGAKSTYLYQDLEHRSSELIRYAETAGQSGTTLNAIPKVSENFTNSSKIPTTTQFWSSMMYQREGWNKWTNELYAWPVLFRTFRERITVGAPRYQHNFHQDVKFGGEHHYDRDRHLAITLNDVKGDFENTVVDDYSDWLVTGLMNHPSNKMLKFTIGHGLPYAFFQTDRDSSINVSVEAKCNSQILRCWDEGIFEDTASIGLSVKGVYHYAIFGPPGTRWRFQPYSGKNNKEGVSIISDLNKQGYFSIAVLPSNDTRVARLIERHAHVHITETRVNWSFDEKNNQLTTVYSLKSINRCRQCKEIRPLTTLYPHHVESLDDDSRSNLLPTIPKSGIVIGFHESDPEQGPAINYQYTTARGSLRLYTGHSFKTYSIFKGLLSIIPPPSMLSSASRQARNLLFDSNSSSYQNNKYLNRGQLYQQLDQFGQMSIEEAKRRWFGDRQDLRSIGQKIVDLLHVAFVSTAVNHTKAQQRILEEVKSRLENWFDAYDYSKSVGDGQALLVFDELWRTLVPHPAANSEDSELNDHYQAYSHVIYACVVMAHFDRQWANDWCKGTVDVLISDVTNPSRDNIRAPFMREMDLYEGHFWSFGHGVTSIRGGQVQRSLPESILYAASVLLWGELTGNKTQRDLGVFLYQMTTQTAHTYWFNLKDNGRIVVARNIFGNGAEYNSPHEWQIAAENFSPWFVSSIWLQQLDPQIREQYLDLLDRKQGEDDDELLKALFMTMVTGDGNIGLVEISNFEAKVPSTRPMPSPRQIWGRYLNERLANLGVLDTEIEPLGHRLAMVFHNLDTDIRTYVVFNPNATHPKSVLFSDGTRVPDVPPNEYLLHVISTETQTQASSQSSSMALYFAPNGRLVTHEEGARYEGQTILLTHTSVNNPFIFSIFDVSADVDSKASWTQLILTLGLKRSEKTAYAKVRADVEYYFSQVDENEFEKMSEEGKNTVRLERYAIVMTNSDYERRGNQGAEFRYKQAPLPFHNSSGSTKYQNFESGTIRIRIWPGELGPPETPLLLKVGRSFSMLTIPYTDMKLAEIYHQDHTDDPCVMTTVQRTSSSLGSSLLDPSHRKKQKVGASGVPDSRVPHAGREECWNLIDDI